MNSLFGSKNKQDLKREELERQQELLSRRQAAESCELEELYTLLSTGPGGLVSEEAEEARERYGRNVLSRGRKKSFLVRLLMAFVSPFTLILIVLATVSAVTDVILAPVGEKSWATVIIIAAIVLISSIQRFAQDTRSGNAVAKLKQMVHTTTLIERRDTGKQEIRMEEAVVGDRVYLSAGDMIPADMRLIQVKDLFINQSALTGESESIEKTQTPCGTSNPIEAANMAFMGTTVLSGSAVGYVVAVGDDTLLGGMTRALNKKPPQTNFEKGINSVSFVLIRFMLVMLPLVFVINGLTKGDWMGAALFGISIAVGLTPQMLPMIMTTCLGRGAIAMSHDKVIIKHMNAIQSLGSMDILCTDKTGTITQDKVSLQYHLNIDGEEDERVLRHAYLNSYYQTGLKNLIDRAILSYADALNDSFAELGSAYTKVDEIPFDFERRLMSVVVEDANGKTQMITKGAVEEMLKVSSFVEHQGRVEALTPKHIEFVLSSAAKLNDRGMRVIAVAQKTNPSPVGAFGAKDETEMVLIGFLAFLDPPKESTADAIKALNARGVQIKVLTGDNEKVTAAVCRRVNLDTGNMILGAQTEEMDDATLEAACEDTHVFAKLSPEQKARIVRVLKEKGHCVSYMGDGINDAAALRESDAGISVDTAVDVAKDTAGVILLEKDLRVLEKGVIEGRKTYANLIKYIKMTVSSNFGNMLSVLAASAFLPFLPMASIHLLLLNLIYDISCIAIPWDHVDEEYLETPRQWDAGSIGRFMLRVGPVSSIFDILTYLLLYFVICPQACQGLAFHQISDPHMQARFIALFQSGWFIESMWSQSLVIHMIRTTKIPFLQSNASAPVTLMSFLGIALLTLIPFTPLGSAIGLTALPAIYFLYLGIIVLSYMVLITWQKKRYIKRYGQWL